MKVNKCGDCIHYESFCFPYALPDEEFEEVGGCRVFKNKADFVEVVRCKDCEYWQDNNGGYPHADCKWGNDETPDADDFCSSGKKKA